LVTDFTVAVIPTRNRHKMLRACVDSIIAQVDAIVIIDNLSDPALDFSEYGYIDVIKADIEPPNISRFWNLGIDRAEELMKYESRWNVAVFNSDVVVPQGWVKRVGTAMRQTTAVLAYSDQCGGNQMILHTQPKPIDLRQRITGYAYMLRGESGLRLDESMKWWYSDDDLDWRARQLGGSLLVPGIPVDHREPNGTTNARPDLQEQAGHDRQTFIKKWGMAPH
jgi:glycosyltransferase involved in cell wall biosynthesis